MPIEHIGDAAVTLGLVVVQVLSTILAFRLTKTPEETAPEVLCVQTDKDSTGLVVVMGDGTLYYLERQWGGRYPDDDDVKWRDVPEWNGGGALFRWDRDMSLVERKACDRYFSDLTKTEKQDKLLKLLEDS